MEDGLTLWGAAHRAPARTLGFLDEFKVDRGGIHLALFHGSERGGFAADEPGEQPHAPFDAAQIEAAGLHHALVGHYHRPRDAERYTYPGNPDFLTFGEDAERGAVVVTVLPDGRVERERHRVGMTEAHDLTRARGRLREPAGGPRPPGGAARPAPGRRQGHRRG